MEMIIVNGEPKFEFKIRAEHEDGSRKTFKIWANNKYEARKAATSQLAAEYKIIWIK